VLKETNSISHLGLADRIYILALWENGLEEIEHLDNRRSVWRVPLLTRTLPRKLITQFIKYCEFVLRILLRFKGENIAYANCHNLSTLPIGILFKILKGAKLIYDPHELETEAYGLKGLRKILSKFVERSFIRFADRVIVVSDSIGKWYKVSYQLHNIYVVKNIPSSANFPNVRSKLLRDIYSLKEDDVLYIYQGGLSANRGVQAILEAFSKTSQRNHVVFMGYGIYESIIKKYEKAFHNIHFQPAVPPNEVLYYTSGADVGISLIENACLSYYYSMPNKVFEYILSGIPVIVSDFPDMGKFIDENHCGWRIQAKTEELVSLIGEIASDDIKEKRNNILKIKQKYSWEKEEKVLYEAYSSM
jgi:glycosyltransferase involved in cell wall biosynthesis